MKIDGKKAYQIYCKYWVSRKFVDIFGFNFLTNNFIIINNLMRFSDLGNIKEVAWTLIDREMDNKKNIIKNFFDKFDTLNDDDQEIILYHLDLATKGLQQRTEHFTICRNTLADFNKHMKRNYTDNIYGLNERFGKYTKNIFEEKLFNEKSPVLYKDFITIIQEDNKNNEIDNADIEYSFKEKECSI